MSRSGTTAPSADRVLDWEGCLNVRDVGGLTVDDRRTRVRRGALIRSDVLCRLTAAGRAALISHGVRTIVDIRSPHEVARDWHAYQLANQPTGSRAGDHVDYLNLPFSAGRNRQAAEEMHAAYRAAADREELNRLDLDSSSAAIAAIVAAIADAQPGGIVVHCHAGKDRTGLIVALLLSLVGVADEDIAADYALTAQNLEPLISEWLDGMSSDEGERARLTRLAEPRPEAKLDTLTHLRTKYGSAEQYLLGAGVSAEQIERLRARLIERG